MFNLRPSSRFQNLLARIAGNENAYEMNLMNQDEKFMSDIAEHIAEIAESSGGGGGAEPFVIHVTVAPDGTATTTATAQEIYDHADNCVFSVQVGAAPYLSFYKPNSCIKTEFNGTPMASVSAVTVNPYDEKRIEVGGVSVTVQGFDSPATVTYIERYYFAVPTYMRSDVNTGDTLKIIGTGQIGWVSPT